MTRPYAIQVLIAFTTPSLSGTPSWTDVTDDVVSFRTSRGRADELAVIQPGTATIVLDCTDGAYDRDSGSTLSPYIRPMRRVRILAQATSGSVMTPIWDGYTDSWTRTFPGGADYSETTVECTDRFKVLARRTNSGTTVQEFAEDRVLAILENGGVDPIIGAAYRNINPGGYATRTVVAYAYDKVNTLTALNDIALSDGGAMFMDAVGVFTFQGTRYRTDNTRATTSQGTFGNTDTAIPVEGDLNASVSDDIMANYVTVTCGDGSVDVAQDTASIAEDGLLELDIGNTLLRALDGPDRAADVLLLRKDPRPRYSSVTVDCTTSDDAMTQALEREISDRITIAFIPPGASQGYSRDQYVEAIAHDVSVTDGTWMTTFSVSGGYGGAIVIGEDGDPLTPMPFVSYINDDNTGPGGRVDFFDVDWTGGTVDLVALLEDDVARVGFPGMTNAYLAEPTMRTYDDWTAQITDAAGSGGVWTAGGAPAAASAGPYVLIIESYFNTDADAIAFGPGQPGLTGGLTYT